MIFFTLAPLAALLASAALVVRHGPSGPMSDSQLPFLGAGGLNGVSPGTFAMSGLGIFPVAVECFTQFMLPRKGVLRSFLLKNVVPGADPVDIVYRVRVNSGDVGVVSLRNDSTSPVRINLTQIAVQEGDLVSILLDNPGFPGAAPITKCVFLWRPL